MAATLVLFGIPLPAFVGAQQALDLTVLALVSLIILDRMKGSVTTALTINKGWGANLISTLPMFQNQI